MLMQRFVTRKMLPGLLAVVVAAAPLGAQERPPSDSSQDFGRFLFPPELIMKYQQKIALRQEQRTAITQAIQELQSKVVELQWRMQEETQKLSELMQPQTVREADALAQVDRVLAIEREIKRAHLAALIRIKNTLTREQQQTLNSLRDPRAVRPFE